MKTDQTDSKKADSNKICSLYYYAPIVEKFISKSF